MHYYKLELQNREENYNQLFGSKAAAKGTGRAGRMDNPGSGGGDGGGMMGGPLGGANLRVGVINPLAQKTNQGNGGGGLNGAAKRAAMMNSASNAIKDSGPLPKLAGGPQPPAAWGAPAPDDKPARRPSSNLSSLPPGVPGSPVLGNTVNGPGGGLNGHTNAHANGASNGHANGNGLLGPSLASGNGVANGHVDGGGGGRPTPPLNMSGLLAPSDASHLASARNANGLNGDGASGGEGLGSGRRPASGNSVTAAQPPGGGLGSGRGRPASSGGAPQAAGGRKWASSGGSGVVSR